MGRSIWATLFFVTFQNTKIPTFSHISHVRTYTCPPVVNLSNDFQKPLRTSKYQGADFRLSKLSKPCSIPQPILRQSKLSFSQYRFSIFQFFNFQFRLRQLQFQNKLSIITKYITLCSSARGRFRFSQTSFRLFSFNSVSGPTLLTNISNVFPFWQ